MSDNAPPDISPAETLLRFFDAMESWELDARAAYKEIEAGRVDPDVGVSAVRSKVAAIFTSFCSADPSPARFDGGRLTFGARVPIYGRKGEEIVETVVRGDTAEVRTKLKGPPSMTLLYTFVRTADTWRLKDNRRRVKADGKTTPWDL